MHDKLIIQGAREHNLKDVSLELPRDSMIVFTGLSGSGKSSLAFDTIFAEGQRRYVESLSSYARQFLGQMDKPDVDFIEGLSPAVSIDQKSTSRNPRSTVGTITEIHDYLRLLYARAGVAHCPECGARIQAQTPQQIVDRVRTMDEGTRFQVLSPVVRGRKGEYQDLIDELRSEGYTRAIIDDEMVRLENAPKLEKKLKHTIEVVVDRLVVREGMRQRLTDSVETALRHKKLLESLSKELGFAMGTPWKSLPKKVKDAILYGKDYEVTVKFRNRWGRERSYSTGFEGAVHYIERKREETESAAVSEKLDSYMREIPCPTCHGARLKPEVLAVRIGDKSIAQLSDMSIADARAFLADVELEQRARSIAAPILTEIEARLAFLVDVGLTYLTLSRGAGTLSGGEAQRIRLATQIGSGLVGVLYVLDEPSIGLHQRDNRKLITTLERLRDLGNTLIVVEHDEETMEAADWIVDIGPGAGETGGWVVHSGPLSELLKNRKSLTGQYLSGKRRIVLPPTRRPIDKKRVVTVKGARENNLKNVDVSFPLGVFTAVTGVSGSGKSTLVNGILYRTLASRLNGARMVPGRHRTITGIEQLDKVVHVDQSPIGRTPRSNPATYTGVWDQIRKLFAETQEAKVRGYGPGRFSFNVKGGRCESCKGDGTLKIEMNFLPDVYVPCEVCHGARYNRETLEVEYKGKTVADVLDMPIAEAAQFFAPISRIARHLNTLVEVGLGYVRLGQSATTLSGGEAQRVKLASELQRRSTGRTVYVLDEPTTGLHSEDIRKLLLVLQSLADKGNTVIVIEHNLDVIKSADWIIDMGPEGGAGGGTVVAQGTPEEVAKVEESFTGQYLAEILAKEAARDAAAQ